MPRVVRPLSARAVAALKHNGKGNKTMHPVGAADGLYLVTYATGSRSWLLRAYLNKSRRHFGLGSEKLLSLGEAREKAIKWRKLIAEGIDPTFKEPVVEKKQMTFAKAVDFFCETELSDVGDKERKAWISTLSRYAVPVIGKLDVADITTNHVAKVLKPVWAEKRELAKKIRVRLDKLFVWLKAKGYREIEVPETV